MKKGEHWKVKVKRYIGVTLDGHVVHTGIYTALGVHTWRLIVKQHRKQEGRYERDWSINTIADNDSATEKFYETDRFGVFRLGFVARIDISNMQYTLEKDAKIDIFASLYLSSRWEGRWGVYENGMLSMRRHTGRQLKRAETCEVNIKPII